MYDLFIVQLLGNFEKDYEGKYILYELIFKNHWMQSNWMSLLYET